MTQQSRRRFLKATAAVGAAASLNVAVLAQDGEGDQEYILLGGNTPGWEPYRLPGDESAEDADQNPTLTLESGTMYTLAWINVDGQPHNFAIYDSDGENMQVLQVLDDFSSDQFEELNQTAGNETEMPETEMEDNETDGNETPTTVPEEELVDSTENVTEEGEVQAVRFTANEDMAEYICEVHPNTMVGDIEIEGGDGGAEGNETEENESS